MQRPRKIKTMHMQHSEEKKLCICSLEQIGKNNIAIQIHGILGNVGTHSRYSVPILPVFGRV